MPAYWVARSKINDPVEYKKYTDRVPAIIAKHGGKVLARGGRYQIMEGPDKFHRFVVIEFPTFEQGVACFTSPRIQRGGGVPPQAARARSRPSWSKAATPPRGSSKLVRLDAGGAHGLARCRHLLAEELRGLRRRSSVGLVARALDHVGDGRDFRARAGRRR